MSGRLLRTVAPLAAVAFLLLAGGTAHAAPRVAARAARHCAAPGIVAGHVKCLRRGQRCRTKYRTGYLRAGFVCRKAGRKRHRKLKLRLASYARRRHGEVIALGASGRPTFKQALWWFDHSVHSLPGVHPPKGAVGNGRSDGGAARSLDLYRKRLTRAQRRVLDRALRPPARRVVTVDPDGNEVAGANAARAAAGPPDQPAVLAEAVRRLRAHGVIFRHPITYSEAVHNDKAGDLAITVGAWLYNDPEYPAKDCYITFFPNGLADGVVDRRVTMVHELMHCAMFEAAPSGEVANRQPKFLDEGLPEFAAYRVGIEWQNSIGKHQYWTPYLKHPDVSLLQRAYSAAGWWALIEHEGGDPFTLQPTLVRLAGSGGARAVYAAAAASAGSTNLEDDWGPTLAGRPEFGPRWDLKGPGQRARAEPDKGTVTEDSAPITRVVDQSAADEFRFDVGAEILEVTGPKAGEGAFRDAAGTNWTLTPEARRFCTIGTCECPDGTKLDYRPIPQGEAHLGFMSDSVDSVTVKGMTVDDACGVTKPTGRIDPKTGIVNGVKLGMLRGAIPHRRTVTSLLGRAESIIDEGGLQLATYDKGEVGVYFRPRKAGRHDARDKVVGVLTYSDHYGGRLSVGHPFPAPDGDCAPADKRTAPGGGPRRVSSCIHDPGAQGVRDIIYMALNSQNRAGQRIAGVGVFDSGVATLLFNSLLQGALDDLGCDNRACT